MTSGHLEAVLIQGVLDGLSIGCSDALIDRERVPQVPGGLENPVARMWHETDSPMARRSAHQLP